MEFKVRKESESLMDKTFKKFSKTGNVVRAEQVPEMMKQMQPDWIVDKEELTNVIGNVDREGKGSIDIEGFNKIALHFLLKQAKHDQDQFIHKHQITNADFPEEVTPTV